MAIGLGTLVLNVLLTRQIAEVERDARAIAESWLARSATLASFEADVREFRRQEALAALSVSDSVRSGHIRRLDSLRRRNDGAVATLRALDEQSASDTTGTVALRLKWQEYREHAFTDRALPSGEGSAALQEFRDREPRYQAMLASAGEAQAAMRAGAQGIALRTQNSPRSSQGLLLARLLLLLAAVVLAELLRRSWKERAEAEQRWHDVADQSVGVVFEVGPTGRVRFCSRSGCEVLGEPAERVSGRHALRFVHRADRRRALEMVREALPGAAPLRDLEVRITRRDGSIRWLAISAQALRAGDGAHDGFRGLAVDITRRAQAEQALAQGRRIEAIGTLAGGVAHDLNNVLTAVRGYAQLAQSQLPVQHHVQHDLSAITAAADRGAALVRRVLQFARQPSAERHPVEVSELVHEVVQLLRPQLPPGVKAEVDLPGRETFVMADPTELHQVVVNIASNAVHAMKVRGSVLRFTVRSTATDVVVCVSDDGDGMAPDVLERAIEPFFTTREIGDGTGMGLAVAHGVVTALGGSLQIESTPGVGTTVTVRVPRSAAAEPAQPTGPTRAPLAGDALRVMLVDDDPHVRNTVARLLTIAGHAVEVYAAAGPALESLHADRHGIDVILTDLTMPGMNGLEFAAHVQAMPGAPPVVMCSGYLDDATSQQAYAFGVQSLLDKPVQSADLLRVLHEAAALARTP
ncbi:MAG: response regulator [Gemmatimonadaceae bacterium]|nr:response regulator [Gemmatimonadaceae bacterium]